MNMSDSLYLNVTLKLPMNGKKGMREWFMAKR